jgi:hypothetical protein
MRDLYKISIWLWVLFVIACTREPQEQFVAEIATAKAPATKCSTVCDVTKNPDLKLITNAQDNPPMTNIIDSTTYFWTKYHVRTHPIHFVQNYLTTGRDAIRYGWDSLVTVNRVQLQCLVENIAPFGCGNDWVFTESQGYLSPLNNYFFDGLFQFFTYEKGNGNNWKLLYEDYKKEFFPSCVPTQEYLYADFCYYDRAVQAQTGDFYYNYFRFPNRDGVYRLVIKFNPVIRGCRAIKETNYSNNEATIDLEIREGNVIIL